MRAGERQTTGRPAGAPHRAPTPVRRTGPAPTGPARRELAGLAALALVAAAAAGFAHLFRATSLGLIGRVWGSADPTAAVRHAARPAVAATVAGAVALAVWLGRRAARRRHDRLGIPAVAAAARGDGPGPSLRGTATRAGATWVASTGLTSIGREGAIIETGGALGSVLGRHLGALRGLGAALAAGGVGAAFAAAYHAPIAGALYVEEHLRVRRDPRAAAYAGLGAALGHLVSVGLLHGHAVLPGPHSPGWGTVALAAIGLVPAVAGARLFLEVRERAAAAVAADRAEGRHRRRVALLAVIAALIIAALPFTSGNGNEALARAAAHPALTLALVLALGKLAVTAVTLAAGVPGGAFTPTLSVSAGWALAGYLALGHLGLPLPAALWDGVLVAMAAGLAVGLRSPLVAVFVVPEMTGAYGLVPLVAVAVAAGTAIDRGVDRLRARAGHRLPAPLHDDDG